MQEIQTPHNLISGSGCDMPVAQSGARNLRALAQAFFSHWLSCGMAGKSRSLEWGKISAENQARHRRRMSMHPA